MENQPLIESTRLPVIRRFTYGVGHVLNDLCASLWFTYLVVFFHRVLQFDNAAAGYVMMTGQVFDAISTPLVGYESDVSRGLCNYGKRKSWHLVGSFCVAVAFIFVFHSCFGCTVSTSLWAKFIYYVPFLFLSQFGWASVQISHLALIPELTSDEHERVELNTIRYSFTVISNITVFVIMWLLLKFSDTGHPMHPLSTSLGPDDLHQFQMLVYIVVAIGGVFCFIFHIGTKEKSTRPTQKGLETSQTSLQRSHGTMIWKDWLKCRQFYQVAGIYMCTRLMVNVSQVYVPLYVTDTLQLNKDYVALIPLVIYISGFVSSLIIKPLNRFLGRKMAFFLSAVLVLGACDWILVGDVGKQVFGIAILLGSGGSMALVTSLSMTADLINQNTESGAFVYGAMSFTDKLSNGLAVLVIQLVHPCKSGCCAACHDFYQTVMAYVPGGAAILSLIILATLIRTKIGQRNNTGEVLSINPEEPH